jgi:ATP-dependent DNA helicase RecQ
VKQLREILKQYWGYDDFRPLQLAAMQAIVESRDSVVVLPTGGGKSLCFQAPAVLLSGLAVVVSPLISLMKDQVDALTACGVPAAYLNSTSTIDERRRAAADIRAGRLKLLYLSPERLMTEGTLAFLRQVKLSFLAIDEAHCISDWGHDFRPEYRSLGRLRGAFPGLNLHAYTATATERVRDDIVRQLGLANPQVLVGSFDRPNLEYRVTRRADLLGQINEIVARHADQSGIIYCIRRRDVEAVCAALQQAGLSALPYHAGMTDDERRRNQEQFSMDRAKIIVATVAFGMGIDKPDVRYVVHAAAPKSLEHYQQESGRAGRDGLEAECHLLYTAADFVTWRRLQENPGSGNKEAVNTLLAGIERFCTALECRHRVILRYFDQELSSTNCGACDVCLDEVKLLADALVVAQKILSCVARLRESFGAAYVGRVLVGSRDARILEQKHDQLSTHGLLAEHRRSDVRIWIDQLVAQRFLTVEGEFRLLKLTPAGWQVLRGEVTPRLTAAGRSAGTAKAHAAAKSAVDSWAGVDRDLFEQLRSWRRQKAAERGVPPFVVFGDRALRDLARRRPSTAEKLLLVSGIGEKKSAEFGAELLRMVADHCRCSGAELDAAAPAANPAAIFVPGTSIGGKVQAFPLFAQGQTVEQVAAAIGRAHSTVQGYLSEFIEREQIVDPAPWLGEETLARVRQAGEAVGWERMKPIFDALEGAVPYEQIRIALACLRNRAAMEGRPSEPA